jgi:hypothetical protein
MLNNHIYNITLVQISQGKRSAEDFKGAWSDLLNSAQNGLINLGESININ